MNDKLTEKLFNRFDFYKPHRSITQSLMSFGFECGGGWFNLLWELSESIEEELKNLDIAKQARDKLEDGGFEVIQVKEKFGTLRFYTNWSTPEIEKLITKAEEKSATTCESCGREGELHTLNGWMSVYCESCYEKEKQGGKNGD